MLKHNYSDKINNRYSYTNKFSYSDEGVDETIKDKITTEDQVVTDDKVVTEDQVTGLRDQIEKEKKDDEFTRETLEECKDRAKKAEDGAKKAVKRAEDDAKKAIKQAHGEAKEAKEQFAKCEKDAERIKEDAGKAINQAKNDAKAEAAEAVKQAHGEAKEAKEQFAKCEKDAERIKDDAKQAIERAKDDAKAKADLAIKQAQDEIEKVKAEAKQAKADAGKAKEEAEGIKEAFVQCEKKVEKAKEEVVKCKIGMAKAEVEWYKKEAEECKKEKGIGTGKPDTGEKGDETGTNKPDTDEKEDETGKASVITSQEITLDCSQAENCGAYASWYTAYNKIGHQGFNTSDLLKELYPEMYSNPKIATYIEKGIEGYYGVVNFKFAFTELFDSAHYFSNMSCKKCMDNPQEIACQDDEIKSFCYPAGYHNNKEYNKSFFMRESCPDLIRESDRTIVAKAKQIAPLILVNTLGQMIDKEGNNTQILYSSLKPYLKANGKIKDCGVDKKCEDFAKIMKKVAWDSDKEVLLKTVFDSTEKTNPYYYDNEDSLVSVDTNFI
ncbi:hypothetical protein wCauA_04460 [Wolbachia endosymbiont of Carposina sasakii]|uniref:cell envelope integrity protein TolA n=1 Tax=unclassified Wolbachia TaxID=2640676 RepID=UPI0002D251E5|nr:MULTISPECIES: hypothetical protein [unclassified Wolbachia]AGJ99911.1 hypothetical protein wHa_04540 [Wolbachia endosymbiont of Drosophila simulans wHa]QDH18838.1 hypothetical protein wCauA_04460 [Wolbachia endosymbiont of Carposina sasakii]